MIYYNADENGFYDSDIPGDIPPSAVEITPEYYKELLDLQSNGKQIACDKDGYPVAVNRAPATQAVTAITVAVQAHMDEQARTCGYDDIKSAVTYADEPAVPKFQAEGLVFREWRSLCWAHCYAVLDTVNAGERAIPTATELIAELPPLELPA